MIEHKLSPIAPLAAIAIALCASASSADSPFFQAAQAPTPARVNAYPQAASAAYPNGNITLLPPVDLTASSPPSSTALAFAAAAPPGQPFAGPAFVAPAGAAPQNSTVSPQQVYVPPGASLGSYGQPTIAQPGIVSSTIIDQPMPTPVPAPESAWTWSTVMNDLSGGMLMPWQLGPSGCDDCQTQGIYFFHNYSSWRGISEGSGANNDGLSYGLNWATKLGPISDYTGIGFQLGASYGLYDLDGRSSGFHDNRVQQQTFVTAGIFRAADRYTNFSFGVVWDGMFNDNFGQYATSPFLSQIRAQIAYSLNSQHEIGVWTAIRTSGQTFDLNGPLSYRGVDQFNLFWHHRFKFGGDGWTWIGVPDHTKLGGTGSLGSYIWGGTLTAPLSPCFGAFTSLQYMAPSARAGTEGAMQETFYVSCGITFYPYANSRTTNVSGNCWMPYMPVANDGTFMVDTNRTF